MKMKSSYDLGFIAIGVAMATYYNYVLLTILTSLLLLECNSK